MEVQKVKSGFPSKLKDTYFDTLQAIQGYFTGSNSESDANIIEKVSEIKDKGVLE